MLGDGGDVELIDGGALLFRLLAPIGGDITEKLGARMIGGNFRRRMREEKILSEAALVFRNAGESLELFRIDDGQVQASLGAVIEEYRINDFPRACRQAEGNVGNAENGTRVGKSALD